jgi:biotin carboxylase
MTMPLKSNRPQAAWLFAGGSMQRAAADAVKARGLKLILTDGNPNCILAPRADVFLSVDTFGIAENKVRAAELVNQFDIRAVFTAAADCHETVAEVARALNLPGIDPAIAHACRYKYLTRKILTEAGIPQPRYAIVRNLAEAKTALADIGLPTALKATDNSASKGFTRLDQASDLNEKSFAYALANGTTNLAIIEELLIPVPGEIAEQSVETVWYDGEMRWLNWVDRLFRKDFSLLAVPGTAQSDPYSAMSWAIELAHINPADHKAGLRQDVEALVRRAGEAMGMGTERGGHILKADIMLTTRGPMILELAPRLSGGWDSSFSTPRRGADFVGGALGLAMGETLDKAYWQRYFQYKYSERVVAVLARVEPGARDCIGRNFAPGTGTDRASALRQAYESLQAGKFLN